MKHETGWSLRQYTDDVLDWTSPSGRHYGSRPDLIMPAPPPPDPRDHWDHWDHWDDYAHDAPFNTLPQGDDA